MIRVIMLEKAVSLPDENMVLFDWLTFTVKTSDVDFCLDLIGMRDVSWEQIDKYMNGYPHRKFFQGVSVLYGASEEMGVCVNMSGQGCRSYESYGGNDWAGLISLIVGCDDINITRLDIAFDDHTGVLNMDELRVDTDEQNYISRSRKWKVEYGSDGTTIYHGSMSSNMMIRIYDKAAERGYPEDVHWIRCEMQMRDKIATGFCDGLQHLEVGTQFRGVLHNYLRYVTPGEDSNRSRWPLTDYWSLLLDGIQRIRCWSAPGVDYNMQHLENFVIRQAGSAIDVYLRVWGYERLRDEIRKRETVLQPKYKSILTQFGMLP